MHVGLTTNASTKTATEFTATLMRELDRKASHSNPNKLSAMHVIGWKGQPAAVVDEVNAVS